MQDRQGGLKTENRSATPARMGLWTDDMRAKALETKRAKRAAWAPVRQPHTNDRDYLRAILNNHGIRLVSPDEPTTTKRLRQLLRRARVTNQTVRQYTGSTASDLVQNNPGVALWWLTAMTLETIALGSNYMPA